MQDFDIKDLKKKKYKKLGTLYQNWNATSLINLIIHNIKSFIIQKIKFRIQLLKSENILIKVLSEILFKNCCPLYQLGKLKLIKLKYFRKLFASFVRNADNHNKQKKNFDAYFHVYTDEKL